YSIASSVRPRGGTSRLARRPLRRLFPQAGAKTRCAESRSDNGSGNRVKRFGREKPAFASEFANCRGSDAAPARCGKLRRVVRPGNPRANRNDCEVCVTVGELFCRYRLWGSVRWCRLRGRHGEAEEAGGGDGRGRKRDRHPGRRTAGAVPRERRADRNLL